jgi:hypothetical protein
MSTEEGTPWLATVTQGRLVKTYQAMAREDITDEDLSYATVIC